MKNLTTLDYWTKAHGAINIELNSNDLIKKWISSHIDFKSIKNVFEIGCYPGRYLTIFGDQGVEVNGLDYIDEVYKIPKIFELRKYKIYSKNTASHPFANGKPAFFRTLCKRFCL